jgi:hypothetical protein
MYLGRQKNAEAVGGITTAAGDRGLLRNHDGGEWSRLPAESRRRRVVAASQVTAGGITTEGLDGGRSQQARLVVATEAAGQGLLS